MKHSLLNKNILFFSPVFFNYEKSIRDKIEELGGMVKFYDERPVHNVFEKALLRTRIPIFRYRAERYFRKIIRENDKIRFDYILIIKCDMISSKILTELQTAFPEAKFCLYLYDSILNNPGVIKKICFFDLAYSFDRKDCSAVSGLAFRPLFYADEFAIKKSDYEKNLYDLAFFGTIHSDRYEILTRIEALLMTYKMKYYSFYYLQSKYIYFIFKLLKESFRNTKLHDFSYTAKSHKEITEIEKVSRTILDIQHPAQTGLTMRTIETIGLQKKLITTNIDIVNYDFYQKENICVIDRKNPIIDVEFLLTPYKTLPVEVYNRYCLEQWVYDVLGIEE